MKKLMDKQVVITHIVTCYLWGCNRLAVLYFPSIDELFSDITGLIISNIFFLVAPLIMTYAVYFHAVRHGQLSKKAFWILNILDIETIVSVIVMAKITFTTNSSYIAALVVLYVYHLFIIIPRIITDVKTHKYMI